MSRLTEGNGSVLEQVVHGYAHGHGLLAGSANLSQEDADLIGRLSDLSGVLPTDGEFEPYLTLYPLPSDTFYAVAKTWPDVGATRAGCVLTHTLLIPTEQWAHENEPRVFANALRRPTHSALETFRKKVAFRRCDQAPESPEIPASLMSEFVMRFFDEGVTPVVWIGQTRPADLTWKIVAGLWPSLRSRFSVCTNALQPRTLQKRPFDLMFASREVYSRFADLDPSHFIGRSTDKVQELADNSSGGWYNRFAQWLLGKDVDPSCPSHHSLWPELPPEPASIRRLFLLKELEARSGGTPAAGIGALDLTASISPKPSTAVVFKEHLLTSAIHSTVTGELDGERVRCQLLLNTRLEQPAFELSAEDVKDLLRQAVSSSTARDPSLVLGIARASFQEDSGFADSAFGSGVLDGLEDIGSVSPRRLVVLAEYPEICPSVIGARPEVGAHCLKAIGTGVVGVTYSQLADCIATVGVGKSLKGLRRLMVPEIAAVGASEVLRVLVQDIEGSEVASVLDALMVGTGGFSDPNIVEIVAAGIGRQYLSEFRSWASGHAEWSNGLAEVTALSYPATVDGLRALLADSVVPETSRPHVIATFIGRRCSGRLPSWLRTELESSTDVLTALLKGPPPASEAVTTEVTRLLDQVQAMPLAKEPSFVLSVARWSDALFFHKLVDASAQSVIATIISGTDEKVLWNVLASEQWLSQWMAKAPSWQLRPSIVLPAQRGGSEFERGFRLVALAPSALYQREDGMVADILGGLTNTDHRYWSQEVAVHWAAVLRRLSEEGHANELIASCARGLNIAFNEVRLPLGQVVAEAFYPVYEAAREGIPIPGGSSLFGFLVWDKPKELRHDLVENYMLAEWAPSGLALACRRPDVLRKVLKEIRRRAGGSQYISRIASDLRANKEFFEPPFSKELSKVVSEFV